jgi:hypothetical protein
VNSAEENRGLDGNPLFRALYGMEKVTLNELKVILKVSAQAEQSDAVNKTTVESTAEDDDFQEAKRGKRRISNNTSHSQEFGYKSPSF